MKDGREKRDEEIALFKHSVIGDLVHLPRGAGSGLYERLKQKSELTYEIPYSARTRIAAETIRDWLQKYRRDGFEGLYPKRRSDEGQPRRIPRDIIDMLILVKEDDLGLTVEQVIDKVRGMVPAVVPTDTALPVSTVYRHLARAGLMKKTSTGQSGKDLRRFGYEKAGELWMSDVMHGPSVLADSRRKRKTYLIAFIDDATRVVPYAEFCLSENTTSFLPVFRQAVMRRGIPKRLYVDNGSAFVSKQLALVCAQLGITLIHARPYHAAGKGKIERFFRRLRQQFLRLHKDVTSLDELNRHLRVWLEDEYHQTPHRGLDGITPFDAWCKRADEVRLPGPSLDLNEMFLFVERRRVQKDRTVSLNSIVYEVDAALVGETVVIKHDPSKPGAPVDIWYDGKKVQTASVVDIYANSRIKRNRAGKIVTIEMAPDQPESKLKFESLKNKQEA